MSLYRKWQIFRKKNLKDVLHYGSLTLAAHAKGPSQKESTLPTIHFERTVSIFRGVWHDDILTVAGLAILINFQAIYYHLLNWLCVYNISVKKTSDFTGCMSCDITVSHLVQCFCKVPSKMMTLLIERTFGHHRWDVELPWLNEFMLLQSTRFKHNWTSSKQHISMVWNSKKMGIASQISGLSLSYIKHPLKLFLIVRNQ